MCSILMYSRKTLHESRMIFVEHALLGAWIQFRTQAEKPCPWYNGLSCDQRLINKWMLAP